jgi:OmpA-OmpF porin, OOP family
MNAKGQKPNRLKCRTCGFDDNPKNAKRCMVCDERIGKASAWDMVASPVGIFGSLGLVALGIFGWSSFSSVGSSADQPAAELGTSQLTGSADSWAGYFWLRQGTDPQSVFGKLLQSNGLSLKYEDEPDQAKRAKRMSEGTYDIAMTTADQVLTNPFGGNIVAMVDVSAGGDAVVLRKGLKSLDDIKPDMKVAYARATPSETLLRTLALRFNAVDLKRLKAVEVTVADEAWAMLKEGKVDVAVVWQPFTGLARREGFTVALTSADAKNVILDVLLASKKVDPVIVQKFVSAYCRAVQYYVDRPSELRQAVGVDSKVSGQELAELSQGINFVPCEESDRVWFDGGLFKKRQAVIAEIIGADGKKKLVDSQALMAFTRAEERRRQKIAALDPSLVAPLTVKPEAPPQFTSLPAKEATNRPVIGSLRVDKVQFSTSSARLTAQGAQTLERFRATLDDFPTLRVLIAGHTSSTGNPKLNQLISQDRAIAVANYFVGKGYPRERFSSMGYGSGKPLPKISPQSSANQRTEFKLVR